ncbi:MAG: hypothetical protein JEZ09_06765 [Salinivirgaceae bacterium]|nr:hypothetical protein [Salinivirgaceae bacterium]
MQTEKLTGKKYIINLKTIHFAMVFGLLSFFVIALFLKEPISREELILSEIKPSLINVYFLILGIFSFFGLIVGEILSRKKIEQARTKILLIEKVNEYMAAKIIKYAMLEAPTLLAIVFYLMAPLLGFVVLTIALLALLLISYPSKSRIIQELNLKKQEMQIFNSPEKLISDNELNNL